MLEFLKTPLFFSALFPLCINDLPDDVICNIAIYADDTILYSKCDQASDQASRHCGLGQEVAC